MNSIWRLAPLLFLLPLLSTCNFFDSKIVQSCEAGLKRKLTSPSGYKRIEITQHESTLSRPEYAAYLADREQRIYGGKPVLTETFLRDFDEGRQKPVLFTLYIDYDEPNTYGTPIRHISKCTYVGNDASNVLEPDVSVDGMTWADLR